MYAFPADGCGQDVCLPLWRAAVPGTISEHGPQNPAVGEGKVFVGAGNTFYAFEANGCGADECTPLWTTTTSCSFFTNTIPCVANGVVYSTCGNNYLYAFDAETGDILWEYYTSGGYPMRSSPVVVNGWLYHAATFNFTLYAFHIPGETIQETAVVEPCLWDLDLDGVVGIEDLYILLDNWGSCPEKPCDPDVDGDGVVDNAGFRQIHN